MDVVWTNRWGLWLRILLVRLESNPRQAWDPSSSKHKTYSLHCNRYTNVRNSWGKAFEGRSGVSTVEFVVAGPAVGSTRDEIGGIWHSKHAGGDDIRDSN